MELGADAVLVNTAIGTAGDPVAMAGAFSSAVDAGRSRVPGRPARRLAVGGVLAADRLPGAVIAATSSLVESRPDRVPPGTAAADVLATDVGACARSSTPGRRTSSALGRRRLGLDDLAALLSGPAAERLEDRSPPHAHRLTVRRFGRAVRLFAPSTCRTSASPRAPTAASRPATTSPGARSRPTRWPTRGGRLSTRLPPRPPGVGRARPDRVEGLPGRLRGPGPVVPELSIEVQVWDEDLPAAGRRRVRRPRRLPGDLRPVDLRRRPPQGQEAKLRLAARRPRSRGGGGHAPPRDRGASRPDPDWRSEALAGGPRQRPREAVVALRGQVALPRLRPAAGGTSRSIRWATPSSRSSCAPSGSSCPMWASPSRRVSRPRSGTGSCASASPPCRPGRTPSRGLRRPHRRRAAVRDRRRARSRRRWPPAAAGYDPVWKDWQRT